MTHTLEFLNGKIYYALIDGEWWFHVQSITTALGVDYKQQKRNISSSPILGAGGCVHTLQIGQDQPRKHFMISERRVAAWLFGVRSESQDLLNFQIELADKIYEITKGQLAPISAAAIIKREAQRELKAIERELATLPQWQAYQKAKSKSKMASNRINKAVDAQADLFSN